MRSVASTSVMYLVVFADVEDACTKFNRGSGTVLHGPIHVAFGARTCINMHLYDNTPN